MKLPPGIPLIVSGLVVYRGPGLTIALSSILAIGLASCFANDQPFRLDGGRGHRLPLYDGT